MTPKPCRTEAIKTTLVNGKSTTSKQGYPIISTTQKNNGLASYSLPNNWKP